MGWKKLPVLEGPAHRGCLCCGHTPRQARMDMAIAAGFGRAEVSRDGEVIWEEKPGASLKRVPRLRRFEKLAAADADHDWRVLLDLPLRSAEYQRHGSKLWVLVKSGLGFA